MNSTFGFTKVKQKYFAFHSEQSVANTVIPKLFEPHEICDTKRITFRPSTHNGIIIRKGSPFRERFKINWLRMLEAGIANRRTEHWEGRKFQCISNAHFESVDFNYVLTIFFLLFIAFVIALLILLCELAWTK